MKAKIILSFILIILTMLFLKSINAVNTDQSSSEVFNPGNKFLITAMHSGFDPTDSCNTEFSSYALLRDTLRFNGWHRYNCWFNGDGVFGDSSVISQGIAATLSENNQHGLRTIFDRPITRYLAYGQRSDYQCEQIFDGADYFFHAYDTSVTNTYVTDITDDNFNGGGAKVKFCSLNAGGPGVWSGYINKHLRSNREQCNRVIDHTRDDTQNWYVKPRIRIDTAFANNSSNANVKVCRIDIIDWNGDTIRKNDIKVRNFRQNNSTRYNGEYLEEFFFSQYSDSSDFTLLPTQLCPDPIKNAFNWDTIVQTDFRVYWYGQCEMRIDYVRVENEPANQLFEKTNSNHDYLLNRLISEINLAANNSSDSSQNNFYNEEFEFNMTPSTQRLSVLIDSVSQGKLTFMVNLNMEMYNVHIPRYWETHVFNASEFKKYLIDSSKIKIILPNPYFLEGWRLNDPFAGSNRESYNPNTLPVYSTVSGNYDSAHGLLAYATSPASYDSWLQFNFDDRDLIFNFTKEMKICDELSKNGSVDIIDLHQSHMWNQYSHKLKEPTNEELEMTANLALTYGSKGIMYFAYNGVCTGNGYNTTYTPRGDPLAYSTGFVDRNKNVRDTNAYGQNKWNFYKKYDRLLEKWESYIMNFDNEHRKSFIYRNSTERTEMKTTTFIKELQAYPAREFAPDPVPDLTNDNPETNSNAYLQAAFFQKENETEQTKYFMIVNKRCSPYINYTSANNIGGRRLVTMKINPSNLLGFNNWKIYNVETGDTSLTFSKYDTTHYVFVGDFMPGEGRLYKIAPVMQEGGTLVADEEVIGNFDCKGEVNNNGKNITLKPATTINFTNNNARIKMTGGNFRSGLTPTESTTPVYLKGKNGNFWKGLFLNECSKVEIMTTYFENISPYPVDSTYAAQLVNCEYINISYSSFLSELDIKTGGILINYTSELRAKEAYVNYNHFEMDAGEMPAMSVITSGYITFPMIIEGNEFESYTGNSSNAILLSGVVGGAIKENQITGYKNGIILIWSSMDLYGNTITGGDEDSKGILAYAYTFGNLSPFGGTYTGGFNVITCEGENAKCIDLNNSFTYLQEGYNTFDLKNYEPGNAFHLSGTVPDEVYEIYGGEADATNNCFRVSEVDSDAVHNLIYMNEDPVYVDFIPYSCNPSEEEGFIVFDLGNGMNDTIYTEFGGSGGSISNVQSSIINGQLRKEIETVTIKSLEDSVSINLRKRDYERVSELGYELLTDHMDSLKDAGTISKLYLAESRLDTSGNRITNLKSSLEELILNNPEKESFLKQAFYFIQKCKVSLGEYQSAMNGFQQIIYENPYSYEGLVASWDYSATSLLLQGSGGGERDLEFGISDLEFESELKLSDNNILNDDPKDKYDKKAFSKEDRKIIRQNVFQTFESSKEKEIKKIKALETKISQGAATVNEKSELQMKKVLSELIKVKEPKDISEHLSIVNNDIQKVFGVTENNSSKEIKNIIPIEYNLSQNYPNPFNPTTKITFDLPNDSKVKLIVYDLLGREVKSIVNGQLLMGRHEYEFDGSNLASGVYFYRLESKEFTQTKRMVLIK